jgi:hypothetical protein
MDFDSAELKLDGIPVDMHQLAFAARSKINKPSLELFHRSRLARELVDPERERIIIALEGLAHIHTACTCPPGRVGSKCVLWHYKQLLDLGLLNVLRNTIRSPTSSEAAKVWAIRLAGAIWLYRTQLEECRGSEVVLQDNAISVISLNQNGLSELFDVLLKPLSGVIWTQPLVTALFEILLGPLVLSLKDEEDLSSGARNILSQDIMQASLFTVIVEVLGQCKIEDYQKYLRDITLLLVTNPQNAVRVLQEGHWVKCIVTIFEQTVSLRNSEAKAEERSVADVVDVESEIFKLKISIMSNLIVKILSTEENADLAERYIRDLLLGMSVLSSSEEVRASLDLEFESSKKQPVHKARGNITRMILYSVVKRLKDIKVLLDPLSFVWSNVLLFLEIVIEFVFEIEISSPSSTTSTALTSLSSPRSSRERRSSGTKPALTVDVQYGEKIEIPDVILVNSAVTFLNAFLTKNSFDLDSVPDMYLTLTTLVVNRMRLLKEGMMLILKYFHTIIHPFESSEAFFDASHGTFETRAPSGSFSVSEKVKLASKSYRYEVDAKLSHAIKEQSESISRFLTNYKVSRLKRQSIFGKLTRSFSKDAPPYSKNLIEVANLAWETASQAEKNCLTRFSGPPSTMAAEVFAFRQKRREFASWLAYNYMKEAYVKEFLTLNFTPSSPEPSGLISPTTIVPLCEDIEPFDVEVKRGRRRSSA